MSQELCNVPGCGKERLRGYTICSECNEAWCQYSIQHRARADALARYNAFLRDRAQALAAVKRTARVEVWDYSEAYNG